MDNHIDKLKGLVKSCRVCMFGTIEKNRWHFRPMAHAEVDELGNIWFFTSLDSANAEQAANNPNVHLTYSCEGQNIFLSIEGIATVGNTNRDKMEELYDTFVKTWFPEGLDDPSLALVRVRPVEIDCWLYNENKVITHQKLLENPVPLTEETTVF